ncbi:MAG TPA: Na+-transporting oxaloacetate decarboxylase subunit gamma [Epsilonproteobacteria bacterium]|nr:Na+-transporting oxaloacetate decarboxylase subunit gamma [Campylobacterota bacterium]
MEIDLVGESLKFMVLGMIVVFVFLAVLVQLMKLQAKLIEKYFPEKEPAPVTAKPAVSVVDDKSKMAAIIAAITELKKTKS